MKVKHRWAAHLLIVMLMISLAAVFSGCSMNLTAEAESGSARAINNGSPSFPFPQAENNVNPNVIRPNHRTQAQLNQDVLDFFNYWENAYVKESNGNTPGGGYYIKAVSTGGHAYPIKSNSEAHGYGMLIYALMGDKEHYDGMWNMFNQHRSTGNPEVMSWVITEEELAYQDGGSATDGDFDVAYSMLLAHKQWGSDGAINYLAEAKRMITKGIKVSDIGSSSYRTLLGDWDTNQNTTRSSDWMAGHLRAFKEVTGDEFFGSAADTIYQLINSITTAYSPNTGLMPDFIVDTDPKPAPPYFLEFEHDGNYYYNACRYPWRIATDYAHFGTPAAKTALAKVNSWLKTKTSNDPAKIESGFELNGTTLKDANYFTGAFAAPFIAGMTVDSANQAFVNAGWDAIRNNKETYYEDNVTLLCMLLISGNWWNPVSTVIDNEAPTQPGTPSAADVTYNSLSLSWGASTDNVSVSAYRIFSGDTQIARVSGGVSVYQLNGLQPNTSYTFTVQAEDSSGNVSEKSQGVTVITDEYIGARYTVAVTAGGNGSVSPLGDNVVLENESISVSIIPAQGYTVEELLLDGQSVSLSEIVNDSYTLTNVNANHTIAVSFVVNTNPDLSVDYTMVGQWSDDSFHATVTITNNSTSDIAGWEVSWGYPNQTVTSSWSCNLAQNGTQIVVKPASWNSVIPGGGSVTFGLLGKYTGSNDDPQNLIVE